MGQNSRIDWCDHTYNPWHGCAKVKNRPACDHCYAERDSKRRHVPWGPDVARKFFGSFHWQQPEVWDRRAAIEGGRNLVFCGSMCDLFELHGVMEQRQQMAIQRERLWSLIERTRHLTWLLLTKRPENIAGMVPPAWLQRPRPNVWYGATVENQEAAQGIAHLAKVPAEGRFISAEPLRGDLYILDWLAALGSRGADRGIHWVIAGGESGPAARPSHPDWFRNLRDQCQVTGVPFFFKQWGEWASVPPVAMQNKVRQQFVCQDCGYTAALDKAGLQAHEATRCVGDLLNMYRVGKSVAYRKLDGVEHRAFPEGLG